MSDFQQPPASNAFRWLSRETFEQHEWFRNVIDDPEANPGVRVTVSVAPARFSRPDVRANQPFFKRWPVHFTVDTGAEFTLFRGLHTREFLNMAEELDTKDELATNAGGQKFLVRYGSLAILLCEQWHKIRCAFDLNSQCESSALLGMGGLIDSFLIAVSDSGADFLLRANRGRLRIGPFGRMYPQLDSGAPAP
jgi:hypothetical protein